MKISNSVAHVIGKINKATNKAVVKTSVKAKAVVKASPAPAINPAIKRTKPGKQVVEAVIEAPVRRPKAPETSAVKELTPTDRAMINAIDDMINSAWSVVVRKVEPLLGSWDKAVEDGTASLKLASDVRNRVRLYLVDASKELES